MRSTVLWPGRLAQKLSLDYECVYLCLDQMFSCVKKEVLRRKGSLNGVVRKLKKKKDW